MTEKQEKILNSALELFAVEGYHAVSTSKIAKHAGVSEALIFRHFDNKEGLLKAILIAGKERVKKEFAEIVMATDPKTVIRKTLELPYTIPATDYELWRLTYSLKWQTNSYDNDMSEPLKMALVNAFKKLNAKNPEAETELILILVDGSAASLLLHEPANKKEILQLILSKYDL